MKKFKIINIDTKTEVDSHQEEYFIDMYGNVYKAETDENDDFDLMMQIHLAYEEIK